MTNKIKHFAIILSIPVLVWNCGGNGTFNISGTLDGWENDSLSIQELSGNSLKPVTTLQIGSDGQFEFSDTASSPRFLFLKTSDNKYISLLVMKGQDITLSASKDNFNDSYKVRGSEESELVWELNSEMRRASLELDSLSRMYNARKESEAGPQLDSWLRSQYQDLKERQRNFIIGFIEENYESPASLLALSHQLGNEPVLNPQLDFDYFVKVDSALSDEYPGSPLVETLHRYVEGVKQQQRMTAGAGSATSIGAEAPEINLQSPDGENIKLSSLRGKYVLLDFWAAWCAPCRRENPNLVDAYGKFKDKGFEIYQVSLDRTRDAWVKAIKDDKLDWVHVSDLKYWNSEAAQLYGVQSIPASFLLDPDGKIIAKNLRGPALHEKLKEVLN
jgi:peroxiredoxin